MRANELTDELKALPRDLKALPDDVRDVTRNADEKLREATRDRPAFMWATDIRVVLTAAALAVLLALVFRWAGLGFVPTLLLFALLFGGVWAGITRLAAPRKPTRRV